MEHRNAVPRQCIESPSSMDVLHRLTSDLTWTHPNGRPNDIPVAQISYSKEFSLVMGVYMALMRNLRGGIGGGATGSCLVVPTTRWLMILGFVIKRCPSHYTAWTQRRDVLFNPKHLLQFCTSEAFCEKLPEELHEMFETPLAPSVCAYQCANLASLSSEEADTVTFWTPSRNDVAAVGTYRSRQHGSGAALGGHVEGTTTTDNQKSDTEDVEASDWRTALWELRLISRCFVRECHKNFQLWHHRKEVISWAIARTPPSSLTSVTAFNDFLRSEHDEALTFEDFDERAVCDSIIGEEDSKNYHVWSHRMWFLGSFPFLAAPFRLAEMCEALRTAEERGDGFAFIAAGDSEWIAPQFAPLPLSSLKRSIACAALLPPSTFLREEMCYTAEQIAKDWFNNSAWCHRFAVLKKFVVQPLVEEFVSTAKGRSNCASDLLKDLQRVLWNLLFAEVDFGMQWATFEPCNECPYVYCKGIADLWQLIYLDQYASILARGGPATVLARESNSQTSDRCESPLSLAIRISDLTKSLILHRWMLTAIDAAVLPRVSAIDAEVAEGGESSTRSRFLKNNTHQPLAAKFRVYFDLLEFVWTCVVTIDSVEGAQYATLYPPVAMITPASDGEPETDEPMSDGGGNLSSDNWMDAVSGWERKALSLGRKLYHADRIRAKYWKHQVHIVLHRQYA